MPLNSSSTGFYVDFDLLRSMILKEMSVRACTQYQITKDTGVNTATLSNFLGLGKNRGNVQKTLGPDVFVTLMKWGDFPWGNVVKRRKGFSARHTDTKDQAEMRKIVELLAAAGVKLEDGESVSDMLARAIGPAK